MSDQGFISRQGRHADATADAWPGSVAPFGTLLRDHRQDAGLSQDDLAGRAGLSVDAISLLERGLRRSPRHRTVAMLADALRLDEDARRAFTIAARRGAKQEQARVVAGRRAAGWATSHLSGIVSAMVAGLILALAVTEVVILARSGFERVPFLGPTPMLASVQVEAPSTAVGRCPSATFSFQGKIHVASGHGLLTYHWVYPDGRQGSDIAVHVSNGEREVYPKLVFQYTGKRAGSGVARLVVTSPATMSSASQPVVYRCP